MNLSREQADAVLRCSFPAFVQGAWRALNAAPLVPNWHIDAIAWRIQQMIGRQRETGLVINLPPRSLKSFILTVCLPAWVLGIDPTRAVVTVSYSDDLTRSFSRACRDLMTSSFYKRLFPATRLSRKKASESEFETTKRGYRLATSVGGTLTGRGCDLMIIDDPLNASEAHSESVNNRLLEWFAGTAMTRLNQPGRSKVVVVMQRLRQDDLAGRQIERSWPSLVLPAVAEDRKRYTIGRNRYYTRKAGEVLQPRRYGLAELERVKLDIGSYLFSAQYQQNPVPREGNLISRDWLKYTDDVPSRDAFDRVLLTCDPAAKSGPRNDYTALALVGVLKSQIYVMDVERGHWNVLDMKARIERHASEGRLDEVVVEDTASGPGLVDLLESEGRISTLRWQTKQDKEARLLRQQAKFECGQIILPKTAPWLADFLLEMLAFPSGRYDDQVDALMLALEWYDENKNYLTSLPIVIPACIPRDDTLYDRFGWPTNWY